MVTLRKRTRTLETAGTQEEISSDEEETQKKKTMKAEKEKEKEKEEEVSRYEQCREMRIKENKERMQKLMGLSLKLYSEAFPSKPISKKPSKRKPSSSSSLPTRRSSRLEKAAPVNYAEPIRMYKKQAVAFTSDGDDDDDSGEDDQDKGISEEEVSRYEQCREMRIKENKGRMQKLMDLSLKLKSETFPSKPTSKKPSKRKHYSSSSLPPRRSTRLEKVAPVNYTELEERVREDKEQVVLDIDSMVGEGEGEKPEIYSEEHDKLLGTCKSDWTLYVDGYGTDGKRIYDPENGVSCHQCRQKTLGSHTHCSKCKNFQGQFCGDCLYMRYGENVLEANQNPKWICPRCRGICNCSLCRKAKGWVPTGNLYRKVTSLGFKSVAHFLIQTRRSKEETGTESTNQGSLLSSHSPSIKVLSDSEQAVSSSEHDDCTS